MKAYDADADPQWLHYLNQHGSLGWKRGSPEYERLMLRYQKEGVRFENKKNDRKRAAKQQPEERDRALERHPLR